MDASNTMSFPGINFFRIEFLEFLTFRPKGAFYPIQALPWPNVASLPDLSQQQELAYLKSSECAVTEQIFGMAVTVEGHLYSIFISGQIQT